MKAWGLKSRFLFILLAVFLLAGCAGADKYERGKGICDRGQYWSRTAEACVPVPGP